jgi:hypothetical protein
LLFRTLRAVRFLFIGPFVLVIVYVVSRLTPAGEVWFKWAALGIGIAWFVSLIRVVGAVLVAGGLAALIAYVSRRRQ